MDNSIAQFARHSHRRNISETVFAGLIFGIFVFKLLSGPATTLAAFGYAIGAVAAVIVVAVTWSLLAVRPADIDRHPPMDHPAEWHARLTRHARILRMAWLWYVLPLGVSVFFIVIGQSDTDLLLQLVLTMLVIMGGLWVTYLNIRAAESIESLRDTLTPSSDPA